MEWFAVIFKLVLLVVADIATIRFLLKRLLADYRKAEHLSHHGARVSGVVIDVVTREDVDQHPQYAPVVEFYTHEGVRVVAVSRVFNHARPALNSTVSVCYDEENPLVMLVDAPSVAQANAWMLLLGVGIIIFLNTMLLLELLRGGFSYK
jgi:Protein of unknown function (DUF3592)